MGGNQGRSWARRGLLAMVAGALLLGSSGCPSVAARTAIVNCQFNVRSVRIPRITPFEVQLRVTLGVHNPNKIAVIVDRFDYVVLVDGRKLADGANQNDVRIPVNKSRDLTISVRANVVDAAAVVHRLRRGGKRTVTVRGTVYVKVPWGRYPFPVEVTRRF